jgi:HEAT repeats
LGVVAVKDGKLDPAIIAALDSRDPTLRAGAALIVGAYGNAEQRNAVLALLNDKDTSVRFRASQGLLIGGQKAGIPALVSFLKNANAEWAEAAEVLLTEIAGAAAPRSAWKDDKESRAKSHAAWLAWWNENQNKLDLGKVDVSHLLGFASSARMAKDVGLKFWKALAEGDMKTLRKTSAMPFRLDKMEQLATHEALEKKLLEGGGKREIEQLFLMSKFTRVIKAREFGKIATEEDKEYLENLPASRSYAVCVHLSFGGMSGEIAWIVQVRGGAARVVGLAQSASLR